jgi:uncharacterized protein YeaO (DUF488 family)
MGVRTKSVYDPPSEEDGRRVLVTQFWPRGISRDRVDEYVRAVAPSRELVRGYKDGRIPWPAFRERYLAEMERPEAVAEIRRLAEMSAATDVTLLCTCREGENCHRHLLRELVARAGSQD